MMAASSDSPDKDAVQKTQQRLQIYPTATSGVSPFWRDKYERDAKKYWDIFYKRHQDRFFKDRHYLDKEWGCLFSGAGRKVILEVGCGAGNTIFPLLATYPDAYIYACDFSPRAVDLVKSHKDFRDTHVSAFVCDLTADDLSMEVPPASVDFVTMIFMLSAVSPEKMSLVLQNIRKVLKPNGCILFRDYATGDLAQERFTGKDQKISENFYVRGDGTRAYYFSTEFLTTLFNENGFNVGDIDMCCKQVENRSRELVMNRRWIQAVFYIPEGLESCSTKDVAAETKLPCQRNTETGAKGRTAIKFLEESEIDISEGLAFDMFGISPCSDNEIIEINLKDWDFKIRVLSKEHQHTCKSTGLMLWESARLMASVLAGNLAIVAEKRVLELGCGCGGLCSMVAALSADLVVATDGDPYALDLLTQNITSNLKPPSLQKLSTKKLEWGNADDTRAVKQMNSRGFDVIIGTDVTYVSEAVPKLFATAKELIASCTGKDGQEPCLVLCHVWRRVDEASLLSTAGQFGFRLVDNWAAGSSTESSHGIIKNWFSDNGVLEHLPTSALNILFFLKDWSK